METINSKENKTTRQKPLGENTATYCFFGEIDWSKMGDGFVVVGDECNKAIKCSKPIDYPNLKIVLSSNQDICNYKSSLKAYFLPSNEIYIPEILICYNSETDKWEFQIGNENEIESAALLDICPSNIQNMGEILIDDVHNFPSNHSCDDVIKDIMKHYVYGLNIPGTFTLKSILMAHEEEHKKDFKRLYELHKEAYLSTAQLLLKPCKEFTDENAAKAYYEPIIREYMKRIYMVTYYEFIKLGGADGSYERLKYELDTHRKIYGFIKGLIAIAEVIYCT
jgi:hypothetical protein